MVDVLKEYNQEHIINLLNKLEEPKKQELLEQINKIDFHQIMELYDNTKKEIEIKDKEIKPIEYLDKEKMSKEEKEKFDNLGIDVIKKGKAFQNHFFSSLFSDIDEKHQKIFKETLELMEKNIDCLLEEK